MSARSDAAKVGMRHCSGHAGPLSLKMSGPAVATSHMKSTQKISRLAGAVALLAVPLTLLGSTGQLAAASIYKCVDQDGSTTYTSQPCGEQQQADVVGKLPRSPDSSAPLRSSPGQRADRTGPSELFGPGEPDLGEARQRVPTESHPGTHPRRVAVPRAQKPSP